jgi:carboxyl-terminal processing protease
MDLLLGGSQPSQTPESWMKRYLKPLLVAVSVLGALFLTVTKRGPEGGINITANRPLRADPERRARSNYDLTALKVLNVALVRIKDNYVDPKRVSPKGMLVAAMEGVERTVAEVLVQPKGDQLLVRVDNAEKTFDLSGIDSPWALSSRLKNVLRFVQAHLRKGTDLQDVEYAAINGMLSTLDPHSILLKPDTYNEMKLSTRGEFGGLGIVISLVKGNLTVMNPMKDTPADQAGIKACDQIVKIGEESTVNMTLTQAVNRLRGAPGSKIDVTIQRGGWDKPVRKTLTRAIIKVPSVTSQMLAKKIGYVRISSFQGNTYDDLRDQLEKMKEKGMKGLVMDLRGNPGGLLDQAIKISDAFVESGTLLTTVSYAGKQREEKRASADGNEPRYPIALLVNSGSASASEIVAGALKNLDRAVIIGNRTFGKGSVQVLYDNDDGSALKLTIAQYLTPGDISIQSVGIMPDLVTVPAVVRKDFVRLRKIDNFRREQDLEKHLTHRNVKTDAKPLKEVLYLAERADAATDEDHEDAVPESATKGPRPPKDVQKEKDENLCLLPDRECKPSEEDKFVEDFQIQLARDLLARARGWRRSQVLQGATAFFSKKETDEEQRIEKALKKVGVDWAAAKPAGKPKIKVAVTTEPTVGKAKACHRLQIKVTARNDGDAPTAHLRAISSSTNKLFDGHEFVFGKVEPHSSVTWTVPVDVRDAPTRVDDVTLKFEEANGNVPPPYSFPMSIQGVERPTFAYGYQVIDDVQANQDGKIQRGEQVRLLMKVRNTGKGTSFRTITTLSNLSGVGIFIRKGMFILDKLAPGETKTASFTFDVQPSYTQPSFKLELTVYDDALREFVTDKLEFPVAEADTPPQAAQGTVRVSVGKGVFRAWPAPDAPVVGNAPRGAGFQVTGRTDKGWYRVLVAPQRPAFISAKNVTPGGAATPNKFVPRWQVTPPKLALHVASYATTAASMRIDGVATDESHVADVFVFVRNPDAKIEGRKVFYRSNTAAKNGKELRFDTEIPLWPGANYVTVHARENEEVQAQDTVVIYRKPASLAGTKSSHR